MSAFNSEHSRSDDRRKARTETKTISTAFELIANSNGSQSSQPPTPNSEINILPNCYEYADAYVLIVLITDMIMELININDKLSLHQNELTRFHSRTLPQISVHGYLQRLVTLLPPILLSMVYYIDLLCDMYPTFTVSSLTINRFLIVSATVASKGLSDAFLRNKTYARVGGITPAELVLLELEFLFRVKWQVVPSPETLSDYYHHLVERCDGFKIEKSVADLT